MLARALSAAHSDVAPRDLLGLLKEMMRGEPPPRKCRRRFIPSTARPRCFGNAAFTYTGNDLVSPPVARALVPACNFWNCRETRRLSMFIGHRHGAATQFPIKRAQECACHMTMFRLADMSIGADCHIFRKRTPRCSLHFAS